MDRQQFHLLLKRYVENQSTPEELEFIRRWYELLGNEPSPLLSPAEAMDAEERIWQKIQENILPAATPIKKIYWKWMAAAAVLIVVLGITLIYVFHNSNTDKSIYASLPENDYKEYWNDVKDEMQVRLEDSSIVSLKKGARLKYPIHFQKSKREVYLKGEAFFQVSKNAKRPFYVYSNSIVTHVLGTSFTVKPSVDGVGTEVAVRTGRVEVYEMKGDNKMGKSVVLLPNQKAVFSTKESAVETTLVDNPQPIINEKDSATTSFVAEDKPLSELISQLETTYGVEIVLENDNINNCRFTGNIEKQNLYGKLDFICQSINATYEIKGTKILIRGKGCN